MGNSAHLRDSLNQNAHLRKAMIKLIERKSIISLLDWNGPYL